MIKKLFFTAALLVPGLAYGANPSANLPIQIVPASAVPAPAQAAGFTKLIISDNFQDPSFANTANWLDCAGATSPLWYRAWVGFGTNVDGPCSAITQATDTNGGGQLALLLHWEDSFYTGDNGHAHATLIQSTDSAGNGKPTSRGFYLEVVGRTDTLGGSPKPWAAIWSYTIASGGYEIDGFEECPGGNCLSSNIHNANGSNYCVLLPSGGCGGCPPSVGCSFDITQYHTYAWRQTAGPAGAGQDIIFCTYIDGVKEGCNSAGGTLPPTAAQLVGMPMTHQFGPEMPAGGTFLGNGSTGKNQWIKSIKIWSCDTNPNNNCDSSSNNP
jgi:hypothetical protein